jgi:hypothetical protein
MSKKTALIWPEFNAARALTDNNGKYHESSPLLQAITTIGGTLQKIAGGQIYITPPPKADLEDITKGLNVAFSQNSLGQAFEAKLIKAGDDVQKANRPFISIASKRTL